MTKGEQIVALAMEKVSREGYPKLTEDHPFFGRLRAFMVESITGWAQLQIYLPK